MNALAVQVEGIGFWAPGWPDWDATCAGLRRGEAAASDAPTRPPASRLPPAERRRAPEPVLVACEVAAQACDAAGRDAADLATVFSSTHGDLVITDYMCETLARAPRELSPIRFHNSVHNAPAGYWTIAARCHAASTSISAWHASFAMGLLEAAVQAAASERPVLLVAYDTESRGPLLEVSASTIVFGVALVLAPARSGSGLPQLRLALLDRAAEPLPRLPAAFGALAEANPTATTALPFLTALVSDVGGAIELPTGVQSTLRIEIA